MFSKEGKKELDRDRKKHRHEIKQHAEQGAARKKQMVKENKHIEEKHNKKNKGDNGRNAQCQQVLNCITGGSSPSFPHEFIKGKLTIR